MRITLFARLGLCGLLALLVLSGCGGEVGARVPDNPAPAPLVQTGELEAAEGTSLVPIVCEEDAEERCDALDDDCDGRIDEGCGYADGVFAIVATWGDDTDVDLVVTYGGGEMHAPTTAHGGRGGCGADAEHARIESAAWARPVTGTLRVGLTHGETCTEGGDGGEGDEATVAATPASVSIAMGERVHGPFNVMLAPGEMVEVATLTLSE